jgi:hypothetical protein
MILRRWCWLMAFCTFRTELQTCSPG